jgi:3-methyl-2-oxobutanoate hydroxymethyltransferase
MSDRKPVTVPDLIAKKARGERIVMLTAYDYPTALFADEAGVDVILVGDSLGMVVLGHRNTLPVTMDEMVHHVRAVCRASPQALVIADLPFLSYQASEDEAVRNAGRMLKEGGAQAVKLEGGSRTLPLIERLSQSGIPVLGHIGMTPQSVHGFGGFRVQARKPDQARHLLEEAKALEAAGAFGMVLELVPAEVSRAISQAIAIPTIGIGAGPFCDGEVQIFHDLLGLYQDFIPKHTRRFADVGTTIRAALAQYAAEVRSGAFPAEENTFHQRDLEDPGTWTS